MSAATITKALQSPMICSTVILTDSENSNMVDLHERATARAPATAIKRALVGSYEDFSLLATIP